MDKISRRNALKTLLATAGGLGAAAFLPSRWVKPVVESGVLPVHAQGSNAWYNIEASESDSHIIVTAIYGPKVIVQTGHKHLASPARTLDIPAVGKLITIIDLVSSGGTVVNPIKGMEVHTNSSGIADFGEEDFGGGGISSVEWTFEAANGATDTYSLD